LGMAAVGTEEGVMVGERVVGRVAAREEAAVAVEGEEMVGVPAVVVKVVAAKAAARALVVRAEGMVEEDWAVAKEVAVKAEVAAAQCRVDMAEAKEEAMAAGAKVEVVHTRPSRPRKACCARCTPPSTT
jgi:hypothetical protein